MTTCFGFIILAAGEGTRFRLPLPKPLAPLGGKALVDFPLALARKFLESRTGGLGVVTGHEREALEEHIGRNGVHFAYQEERRGTADAVRTYFRCHPQFRDFDYTIISCADTPLVTPDVLEKMWEFLQESGSEAVLASFNATNPFGYGRILRGEKGLSIVEEKDASDSIKEIAEVNSGLYMVSTPYLLERLERIGNDNNAAEFYLTDIFCQGENVGACHFPHEETFRGVNTLEQLEQAERALGRRKVASLREAGVRFIDSRHVWIENDVTIEEGTMVHPNVHLRGRTHIARNCLLEPGCVITNSHIGEGTVIKAHSVLNGVRLGASCVVGPSAHMREKSSVAAKCKIGNFVETKNVRFDEGVSVSHLSYLGDAEVGAMTNIGCGFVTCNYDGAEKHKTIIGKNCFIGSDTQAIAPLTIGESCYVASGSTLTRDLPDGTFALARSRQVDKPGMAKKFLKGKWAKNS